MKKLLLFFAVMLTALRASAYDFVVNGIYYNVISIQDLTCEVTSDESYHSYESISGRLEIPSTVYYNGRTLTVVRIGDSAFFNNYTITNIGLPNTIVEIGDYAFNSCSKITFANIPNSVKVGSINS